MITVVCVGGDWATCSGGGTGLIVQMGNSAGGSGGPGETGLEEVMGELGWWQ